MGRWRSLAIYKERHSLRRSDFHQLSVFVSKPCSSDSPKTTNLQRLADQQLRRNQEGRIFDHRTSKYLPQLPSPIAAVLTTDSGEPVPAQNPGNSFAASPKPHKCSATSNQISGTEIRRASLAFPQLLQIRVIQHQSKPQTRKSAWGELTSSQAQTSLVLLYLPECATTSSISTRIANTSIPGLCLTATSHAAIPITSAME